MTMTDPIADMLTRIRNGNVAYHDAVRMPSSKLKESLAQILQREGYIEGYEIADDPVLIARRAIQVGIDFDVYCGGEIDLEVIPERSSG